MAKLYYRTIGLGDSLQKKRCITGWQLQQFRILMVRHDRPYPLHAAVQYHAALAGKVIVKRATGQICIKQRRRKFRQPGSIQGNRFIASKAKPLNVDTSTASTEFQCPPGNAALSPIHDPHGAPFLDALIGQRKSQAVKSFEGLFESGAHYKRTLSLVPLQKTLLLQAAQRFPDRMPADSILVYKLLFSGKPARDIALIESGAKYFGQLRP
jgi:hypothetical protein